MRLLKREQGKRGGRRRRLVDRPTETADDFSGTDRGALRRDRAADRAEPGQAGPRDRAAPAAAAPPRGHSPARAQPAAARAPVARLRPAFPRRRGCREFAREERHPELLRAGHPPRRLPARPRTCRPRRGASLRGPDRPLLRRARTARRGRTGRRGLLRGVQARPPLRRRECEAVGQGGRRCPGDRRADADLRDDRDVPSRRPAAAGRGLPRRAADLHRAQDHAAQGRPRGSAAPGTRTAPSWARSAPSTCGSRSRAAATSRRASTSSPAASTTSSAAQTDEAVLDLPGLAEERRGGRRRQEDRPSDLRARRRAVLRRALPARRPAPTRRCRSRVSRSRAGSSAARPSPASTPRLPCSAEVHSSPS